jgi:hypothetical protein
MNNTELWKDIPNYEGLYQVSSLGNVKSLERIAIRPKAGNYIVKEKILNHFKQNNGYYIVNLSKEGKRKTITIHILVAMAFLGHKPDGTQIIVPDHKDGDKSNNRVDNLELITQRENISRGYLRKKTSSQYTGVSWCGREKKWVAYIHIDGKKKFLGYYSTEIEAHEAYQKALNELK